ncbi:TATA box-binding protein-associated factor RNA polymerase I subunit B-like [Centruroides sculpturatus]|uniref:TATA box-binding protein-associated factor RNA polymerase I subunit B-like n=1 Tax=Centruroides sculpturatus TaxID=218467 RepID=UPI000C6D201B|nr:TATA box-binding protein-associated factor RNA polymerase I subunit B-like [Centruroides sculpturatus]
MLNKNKTPIKGRTKSMKFDDVMSMEKTVAFCYLGLLLTEDCILISDIIRWTREDHFPYISVSYLLPSTMILQTTDWKLITPYKLPTLNRINELTEKMANFLGIKEIPEKLLMPIIARFVIDLNLPLELISFIHKLVSTRIPCMKFKLDGLPRYEVRAMAIIVIALKLLFGLNDKTERQLSSLGRKLEEYKNFGNQFFIWEDWVEHMKIQINFIFHSHIPLALFMENDVYDIDRYNLFYDQIVHSHWRPKSAPCSSRNIKKSFEFYDSLKKVFSSLKDSNEEQLSYPKTSFPYSVLLNYYKELYFKNNSEKKLFHHKTLKYLTNCKDYYEDLEITKIYQDQEFNDLILGSKNAFTQDFPYSQYWIAHFQKHTVPEVPYDSFKWLLSVCSCYIEVSTDDLYREVMQLESFVVKDCPKLKVLPRNYTTTVHELKEKTFGRKIKKPKYRKSRKQHN